MTVCHLSRRGKNFLIALLVLALLALPAGAWFYYQLNQPVSIETGKQTSYFESGDGTEGSPYEIAHPVQLYYFTWLQNLGKFNGDNVPVHFTVSADLNMQGFVLPPAGTTEHPFVGSFDGGNHTVSNLVVQNQTPNAADGLTDIPEGGTPDPQIVGFFGVIGNYNGATHKNSVSLVQNLTLNNITVKSENPKDDKTLVGIAAGYVNGIMSGIQVQNSRILIGNALKPLDSLSPNYSDYALVGACTESAQNSLDIETVKLYEPSGTASTFLDLGNGSSWGGSIPMQHIYDRLQEVLAVGPEHTTNAYSNQYVHQKIELTTHGDKLLGTDYIKRPSPLLSYARKNTSGQKPAENPGTGPNDFLRDPNSTAGTYSFSLYGPGIRDSQAVYLSGQDLTALPTKLINVFDHENRPVYYISCVDSNGTTHYLSLNEQKNGIIDVTDSSKATQWFHDGKDFRYSDENGIFYFLVAKTYLTISNDQQGGGVTQWKVNKNGDYINLTFSYQGDATGATAHDYRLTFDESTSTWGVSRDKKENEQDVPPQSQGFVLSSNKFCMNARMVNGKPTIVTEYVSTAPGPTAWVLSNSKGTSLTNASQILLSDAAFSVVLDNQVYYLTDKLTLSSNLMDAAFFKGTQGIGGDFILSSRTKVYIRFRQTDTGYEFYTGPRAENNQAFKLEAVFRDDPSPQWNVAAANLNPLTVCGQRKWLIRTEDTKLFNSTATNSTYFPLTAAGGSFPDSLEASSINTGYIISGLNEKSDAFPYQSGDIRVAKYGVNNLSASYQTCPGKIYDASTVTIFARSSAHSGEYSVVSSEIAEKGESTVSDNPRKGTKPPKETTAPTDPTDPPTPVDPNAPSVTITVSSPTNTGASSSVKYYKRTPEEMGFTKYAESKAKLDGILNGADYAYGLHFMNSQVTKKDSVIAPCVRMRGLNGGTDGIFHNFQMPEDCIDFTLQEKGVVNFFAGSYYPGNKNFFSLHQIIRKTDAGVLQTTPMTVPIYDEMAQENGTRNLDCYAIQEILEIAQIYKHKTQENAEYVYKYTNKNLSVPGANLEKDYELVFDTQWLTNPTVKNRPTSSDLVQNALYYFEIPVNAGEYALGSAGTAGQDGAYLLYLDISAGASKLTRVEITETLQTVTDSFRYPKGVSLSGGENDQIRPAFAALPAHADYTGQELVMNRNGFDASVVKGSQTLFSGQDYILQKKDDSWAVPPVTTTVKNQKVITWLDYNHSEKKFTRKVTTLTDTIVNGGNPARSVLYQEFDKDGKLLKESHQAPNRIDGSAPIELAATPLTVHHYGHGPDLEIQTHRKLPSIDPSKLDSGQLNQTAITALLNKYELTVTGTATGQETPDFTLYLDQRKQDGHPATITINNDKGEQVSFIAGNFYRMSSVKAP